MKYIKGITIFVTLLFISSALTSNTSLNHLNNNQAYASIDIHNNFKEIGEKIKKACPAYQGNLDINIIKGLVTDVLKACLPNSNLPPTTPNPNPNPNVQNATLDFSAVNQGPNYANYRFWYRGDRTQTTQTPVGQVPVPFLIYFQGVQGAFIEERFTIPVGYQYQIQVIPNSVNNRGYFMVWEGDCTDSNQVICIGTMSENGNTVRMNICDLNLDSICPS